MYKIQSSEQHLPLTGWQSGHNVLNKIMYYLCIENNTVGSILNYKPNVPDTVEVVEVTDEEYNLIRDDTHRFDITTKKVVPHESTYIEAKAVKIEKDQSNAVHRQLLNSTDWKILRHIRQKALDLSTSLTEQEYIALENQRQAAASSIIN